MTVVIKIRNLRDLANAINALDCGYTAKVEPWTSSTDTPIRGTRLRRAGKGRRGLRIYVRDARGDVVIDHCNSETYRHTFEAVDKAVALMPRLKLDVHRPRWAR